MSQVRNQGVGFLQDYNDKITKKLKNGRLIVALTRAKKGMVIFGNGKHYLENHVNTISTETLFKMIYYFNNNKIFFDFN